MNLKKKNFYDVYFCHFDTRFHLKIYQTLLYNFFKLTVFFKNIVCQTLNQLMSQQLFLRHSLQQLFQKL